MTYNSDSRAYAPLPSSALPADLELHNLVARARRNQVNMVLNSLCQVIKP